MGNKIKYIPGRNNLALTIFVPYNCNNNCKFCTSKDDYKDMTDFSMDKILESIHLIGDLKYITDIVLTGGEPFADLNGLQEILNTCKELHKNIFINTTLPINNKEDFIKTLNFIIENKDVINGINVSRHMSMPFGNEDLSNTLIKYVSLAHGVNIKINSVLFNDNYTDTDVKEFIKKYWFFVNNISFRGDYRKIKDQNDLRGLEHPLLNILFNIKLLNYLSSGGCLVCNNNDFMLKKNNKTTYISLHRGYEHSLVKKGNNYIVNDIIIKQNGNILVDWDGELLDIDNIKKQWR